SSCLVCMGLGVPIGIFLAHRPKAYQAVSPILDLMQTLPAFVYLIPIIAFFGTGNARAMAAGVSKATIPTMAGMVAALSGVYFASHLDRKADIESEKLEDLLQHD
ncbi:MAG: ABC transporter permease subunit, partial [Wenzhouxiangellaceae bacterium]